MRIGSLNNPCSFGKMMCISLPGFVNIKDNTQPTSLYQLQDLAKQTNAGMLYLDDKIILSSPTIEEDLKKSEIRYFETDVFEETKGEN